MKILQAETFFFLLKIDQTESLISEPDSTGLYNGLSAEVVPLVLIKVQYVLYYVKSELVLPLTLNTLK